MMCCNVAACVYSRPTEIEWRYTEKGERVRVSVRTGRIIPLPIYASETEDFVVPSTFAGKFIQFDSCSYVIFISIYCRFLLFGAVNLCLWCIYRNSQGHERKRIN
jgi:hypothetical protein